MLKSCATCVVNLVQKLLFNPQLVFVGAHKVEVFQSFSDQNRGLFTSFGTAFPHTVGLNLPREPGGLSTVSTGPIINTTIQINQILSNKQRG